MGAAPTNKQNCENEENNQNSTCMKLIQLWLTSFAIGIPSLRLLFFFDFQNPEIIIAVFLTILIFGTMYILDANDRLWRIEDVQPCNEVSVTDGELMNCSSNHLKKMFESTVEPTTRVKPLGLLNETNKREAIIV